MRRVFLTLGACCLFAATAHAALRELSLNDAYALALERSESLAIAAEDIRIAEARYWQAVSAVLPQVNFIGTVNTQNNAGSSINGGSSTGTRKDRWEGRLQVTQTIFNGFREFNAAAALKADGRSKTATLERNRQLLYLDVGDLFFQIIQLDQDTAALREILATLDDRRKELTERVSLGRSRKSELLAAETELADSQASMEALVGLRGAARELFAFLIGVPSSQFTLKSGSTLPPAEKLEAYLWKTGVRPDIIAADESRTAAERSASAQKGQFFPSIGVESNFLALEDPERIQEWNILVTAEIPVFDGGLRIAQLNESKARLRASQLSLARARRLADHEVRVAYNNFISSANQLVRLRQAENTARESYETQKKDYELGRASNLDVLASLLRWKDILRGRIGTEARTQTNLIALQVAAGEPTPAESPKTQTPNPKGPRP